MRKGATVRVNIDKEGAPREFSFLLLKIVFFPNVSPSGFVRGKKAFFPLTKPEGETLGKKTIFSNKEGASGVKKKKKKKKKKNYKWRVANGDGKVVDV